MNTTSETKHTPGPLRVAPHDTLLGVYHIDVGPAGYERTTLAIVNAGPRSKADAELFASAPKLAADNAALLAALRALLEFADNGTPVHPGSEVWDDARVAIARAEGGDK